jgi:hypothetical protein
MKITDEMTTLSATVPPLGPHERVCNSCQQIVFRDRNGSRPIDVVLYWSRNSEFATPTRHWSWNTRHTPENCAAWTAYLKVNKRPAVLGYGGIE